MEVSIHECLNCNKNYNHNNNKPMILGCGHTMCSHCISASKELFKSVFCPACGIKTSSLDIENKLAFKKINALKISENIKNDKEFEVIVRDAVEIFALKVQKEMTVKELKEKINKLKGLNFNNRFLMFKRPLMDDKTLEFYGIVKPCRLTISGYLEG